MLLKASCGLVVLVNCTLKQTSVLSFHFLSRSVLVGWSIPLASGMSLHFFFQPHCHHTPFRDLSSDRWAWRETNGAAGFRKLDYLSDDTTWATAGSRGSLSHIHLDDAGFCTSTQVLTGKKYWAVFHRDPALPDDDLRGNMGSIGWSPPFADWYDHKLKGTFTAEAIEMVAGTLLYVFFAFIASS